MINYSKNSGMNFTPIEYDFHPNEFHTYGMNSASMTFIPTAVRSSYRECEKTSVIPKLRMNLGEAKFTAIHVALRHLIKYS